MVFLLRPSEVPMSWLGDISFGISTVFWICLLLGAGLAVVSLVFGEVLHLAFDTDGGVMSGPVIASFIVALGGAGLILHDVMHLGAVASSVGAIVLSLLTSTGVYFLFAKLILASQGGTEFDPRRVGGQEAEVIIGIPADGAGEITFDHASGRISGPARSATGAPISRGTVVRIERHTGGTYLVRPASEAAGERPS